MNTVAIPQRVVAKMERLLIKLEESAQEWINEDDASKLTGLSKRTLQNKVYSGAIKEGDYKNGVGGRFYNKQKLIGL